MKEATNKVSINNNKKLTFGFVLLFIFLWIIYAYGYDNADFLSYKFNYDYFEQSIFMRFEPGYSFLVSLAKSAGLTTYESFLPLYSLLGLIFLANSFITYGGKKAGVVLLLYAFYPFLYDVIQIRNFLASAIVIFSLRYLKSFNLKNFFSFILTIFIACTIHKASLVYFMFVLAYIKSPRKCLLAAALMSLSIFAIVLIFPSLLYIITENVGVNIAYLKFEASFTRPLGYLVFALIIVFTCLYISKKSNFIKIENHMAIGMENNFYTDVLVRVCMFTIVIPPMLIIDMQYYRYMRTLIIIFYCTVAGFIGRNRKCGWLIIIAFFISIFFFLYHLSPIAEYGGTDGADFLRTILSNNKIMNYLFQ